ncbi:acetyl-CoA C-acetyltransferase [Inhella inkyongensis]|uniref:Acetyl-CoA C-acetyltransferase n=1 Tax=Inhella inkyongensis TaxID=392593 RepID=A0A840S7L7_9BURK|nr:acetyl-CoA C-acetyltransferase [Inhella inkyongensis]MBB5205498.1 acetyl-CoA C-acetyltransferase [Inhella inkyongensis]
MDAYLFDALRTPRGRGKGGALNAVTPLWLARTVLKALAQRRALDTALVDDVLLGCVTQTAEQGGCIARTAVLDAGWAQQVPALTLSRFCASGLEALNLAAAKVACGSGEQLVVAGGVESMSRVPMGSDGGAWLLDERAIRELGFVPQGISADLIATREGFSREQLDAWALRSHQRAAQAQLEGRFARSLVPVHDEQGQLLLATDEAVRPDASLEALGGLRPSFQKMGEAGLDARALLRYPEVGAIQHLHHAGNSSAIVDGAALLLVGSEAGGQRAGLRPRARIRALASVGSEPTLMLTGPAPAVQKALARAGLRAADIDLWEINEAFATVPLQTMRALDIDPERVNVNGGAIALGHPLGATGAMLVGMALDELERRDQRLACITLCVGGGMGTATVIERL